MNILVTGASGFIGQNLMAALRERAIVTGDLLYPMDVDTPEADFCLMASQADFVFHLAGMNRPTDVMDFRRGNEDFTIRLLFLLEEGRCPPVLFSSSTQAALENPYGLSKRVAEEAIHDYGKRLQQSIMIYRLTNVFGKWSRPNYNSVVATFCYHIARGLPIQVNDPTALLRLNYIDDVVAEFIKVLDTPSPWQDGFRSDLPEYSVTLERLTQLLYAFHDSRERFDLVDQTDPFICKLYATYLSFLPSDDFARTPIMHSDERGSFTEILHMGGYGQISVNVSRPRIIKGEHWHQTKHEKFVVIAGSGVIRFRKVGGTEVLSYTVTEDLPMVVDIPPGYTHSIENLGDTDLITLMWANERFNPTHPDTFRLPVIPL